jgi:hypothetical protein
VVSISIATVSSGSGSFTLAATNATVAQGNQGNSTITITPKSGYTGTVDLSFDTSNDTALQNLCYEFTNMNSAGDGTVAVTGTAAVTTQLTLDANAADCVSAGAFRPGVKQPFHFLHKTSTSRNNGSNPAPLGIAFAGLLLAGFLGRYSRKFRNLAAVVALLAVGLGLSACSNVNNNNTVPNPPQGTYTITVTGQDSATATITTTTTFTLVIN